MPHCTRMPCLRNLTRVAAPWLPGGGGALALSLLVLPLMGLVDVSYRMHLRQAVERSEQAPA